jgi:hypothetical protein
MVRENEARGKREGNVRGGVVAELHELTRVGRIGGMIHGGGLSRHDAMFRVGSNPRYDLTWPLRSLLERRVWVRENGAGGK